MRLAQFGEESLRAIEDEGITNQNMGFRFGDGSTVADIVSRAIPIIFFFAGSVLMTYLIYGGIQLMTAGGDERKVEAAKGKVTDAFIGFVIVFTAFLVVQAFGIIFHLPQFGQIFGR